MGPLLVFLLSWYQLQAITQSALVGYTGLNALTSNNINNNDNNNNNNDNNMKDVVIDDLEALLPPPDVDEAKLVEDVPFVRTNYDQTEVEFRNPISSVNIDYARNSIVLKFRKETPKQRAIRQKLLKEAEEQRIALEKNFMRFGRSPQDFMRFGKRQVEELPLEESAGDNGARAGRGYQNAGMRDSRGDNFMRFGRDPSRDYMRFGRVPNQDFMRFGRTPSPNFMRLGRSPSQDFMRFGRTPSQDFMRFGRTPSQDFMRFGRGRSDNFMRLGRSRSSANDGNSNENFMRFGKSIGKENRTKEAQQQKHDIRETAKLLHNTQKDIDENPMDKAIQVLFNKQQNQQQQKQQAHGMQPSSSHSSEETTDNISNVMEQDLDLSDYVFN